MNENALRHVTKKKLRFYRASSLQLLLCIALCTALLLTAFSFFFSAQRYAEQAAQSITAESRRERSAAGLSNLLQVLNALAANLAADAGGSALTPEENPNAVHADILFSTYAVLVNAPFLILGITLVILLVAFLSLSAIYAVNRKETRHFFGLLLAAGASPAHLKRVSTWESAYLLGIGLPIGSAFGVLQTYLLKGVLQLIFARNMRVYGLSQLPIRLSVSPWAVLLSAAFVLLFVFTRARKAMRKTKKSSVLEIIRDKDKVELGLSVFTPSDFSLKKRGMARLVAIRSFQNRIFSYLAVAFMIVVYSAVFVLSLASFHIVRSCNADLFTPPTQSAQAQEPSPQEEKIEADRRTMLGLIYSLELYFLAAAFLVALVSLVSTFNMVTANINANLGTYAVTKSAGFSLEDICKMARAEGSYCILLALCMFLFSLSFFVAFLLFNVSGLSLSMLSFSLSAILGVSALFTGSIAAGVQYAKIRLQRVDLIAALKEEFY